MIARRLLALSPLLAAVAVPQVLPAPAVAQAPAVADVALVQRHLQAMGSMTAAFSQTDRAGKVLTGVLTLKRPGKLRFQYEKGVPILIVAEGGALTFIDYSVRQVQRWPIKSSPLGVLLDPTRDITRFASAVPGVDPRLLSVEARDPKHPEYGRITLVFARGTDGPAGLTLQGWVALDSQNNRTTIRLSNQRYNGQVSDDTFRWNDPRKTGGHR
jgi:outer membrane lipoprotein-sorting protein